MLHISTNLNAQQKNINQYDCFNVLDADDEQSTNDMLLKILYRCNAIAGWTLLIVPDHAINKTMLDSNGIDINKLLVLKQKDLINLEHTLDRALSNGNFAAVITWPGVLSQKQIEHRSLNCSKTALYCFKSDANLPMSKLAH
ncbi:SulA-like leucine-rich domain-containing protein [Pseudoalteromonas luteoviolacea]|uniref:Cell division inhibitor n=1 Tax=Pseudoalteromonas luteoviolacea S4054 TaxID=1129367 RepID=A0A0F6ABM8_9GAMM|nr:SulA-like leucine-rich domain-containing protein [Pseudoalteromonas luteoviolacea]AOT09086.1 hypothetical protein S4054249_15020 [Pseudoalteromonas luteoviolacea]AOT13999.1 hypothetical protein S40542_14990 [Pseudoalteromonas luteoviolacea]AOT18914.1 hypothetical protein S4054_14995 [Pseudoalteromonas luteoviolacea]KKE83246.1 hypothetical protein N479_14715 [Pseudoalteromonas luteoviolacea S4054]KZN73189.1 hypothetical protein N481_12755 [Pseudoalteromonas luteoviolacea S4047-1]